MDNPVRTGFLFGVGFSLTFILVTFVVDIASEFMFDSVLDSLAYDDAVFGAPDVVRMDKAVRDGETVILVTVRNPGGNALRFSAEAALFDNDGAFFEACVAERQYTLSAGSDLSFKASCPSYEQEVYEEVSEIEIQFFDAY
ncbi:MAG: hypothetical protein AAGJ55_08195 [Cyanobacteria bacterium J06555_12]